MFPKNNAVIQTLMHKPHSHPAWIPFAGVHAGKLLGYDAETVLKDEDKLFESLLEVNRLYRPDGQPIVFDLQIEAEILGCRLEWYKDSPPSVKSHPLADTMNIPCLCTLPKDTDGRIPLVLSVMRKMKQAVGEKTALYGLVCGPFTLASHLRGNDIFMDMYDDEDYVISLMEYCTECAKRVTQYYIDAGMDVIAVVDPLVSQVSADHFTQFLSKSFADIFDFIREKGVFSSFFVCGDATRNIEVMCLTEPDCIAVDENVDIAAAKQITDKYNMVISGNIPLTSIMLYGSQQDNMKYVVDMLDSVEDRQNMIVSPGCDMPYEIPVENTIAVAQAALHTDDVRGMLKDYVAAEENIDIELPDYTALKKPFMEVFTLDSQTCAACTYMLGAAKAAKERYGDAIDMIEYKYTIKENISRCIAMGVKKLPSIYINGELKFASIIPSNAELDAAIDEAIAELRG